MDKIDELIGLAFGADPANLRGEQGPDDIEGWDSVSHLVLFNMLEEELGIVFDTEEIAETTTIEEIRNACRKKR